MQRLSNFFALIFGIAIFVCSSARAQEPALSPCDGTKPDGANLFSLAGDHSTKLFTYRSLPNLPEGYSGGEYLDLEGHVVAREELRIANEQPAGYRFENFLEHEIGVAEIDGRRLNFRYNSVDGLEEQSEELADDYVIGPFVSIYLQRHWEELLAGKRLKVRIGIITRLETIGFEFRKVADEEDAIPGTLHVVGRPSNIFLAALVSPHHLIFDTASRRILSVSGRTQLEVPVKPGSSKFKGLDAAMIFFYFPERCASTS